MILHSPDHDCETCERLNLGMFAYREIAAELGSDDPEVIDPVWRARCEARLDAHNGQAGGALALLLSPDRRHAAA